MKPERISLSDIEVRYMRKYTPPAAREALKRDIEATGQHTPVLLTPKGVLGDRHVLADGHMRLGIAQERGQRDILAVVDPALDTAAKVIRVLFSSEQRSDRNPVDFGRYLTAFADEHRLPTQKAIAEALSLSEPTVCRVLMPFAYPEDVIDMVGRDVLKIAHLAVVNPLKDLDRQTALLRQAIATPMTAAALKKLAFPPRRKATGSTKLSVDGLTVTFPAGMTFEGVEAALGRVREQIGEAFRNTPKKQMKVMELMASVSVQ